MPRIDRALVARAAGAAAVAAALFTAQFEGHSNKVYLDPVGIPTVCDGHARTDPHGKLLRLGQTYSDEVCSYLLGKDISEADKAVQRLVKVPPVGTPIRTSHSMQEQPTLRRVRSSRRSTPGIV